MKPYVPTNWYWIVGGDETRVFSSAAGDYVPVSDPTYQSWAADGTQPTRIDTEVNLGEVLADGSARPSRAAVLDGYKDTHARRVVAGAAFKVLFNHENRLRAIERQLGLNGSPADLTAGQARNAIKALM